MPASSQDLGFILNINILNLKLNPISAMLIAINLEESLEQ